MRSIVRRVRAHPEVAALPVVALGLVSVGFSFSLSVATFTALVLLVTAVIAGAYRWWPGQQTGAALHARIALEVVALTTLVYATGWGPALALVYVIAIADNVRHSGSQATRPAFDWSLAAIALGQLAIQLDVAPSLVGLPAAHGVAVLGAVALGIASQRIHAMTSREEAAHARAATSEQRFRSLVAGSSDVTFVIADDGRVTYQSPSAKTVLGYPDDALVGRVFTDLVHPADLQRLEEVVEADLARPDGRALVENRLRTADGAWLPVESSCRNLVTDPHVRGIVVNTRDISDRKDLEAQLQHRAFHDGLTGLANRHLFRDRVAHAVSRGQRRDDPFAVLFLDLDGFKMVNDTLGHAAGDELLKVVSERILRAVRDHDTVARLGGDEFAVLLEDMNQESDAARVAERMLNEIRQPALIKGSTVQVDSSIGIAVSDTNYSGRDTRTATDELLRNADIAMYMAKGGGKGRYELFEPSMHVAVVERLKLESDLQHALDHDEFELHYQPIVGLDDGTIVGVEALLRWRHPQRGMVSPGEFIPLAEETNLIVPIGEWVVREACKQVRTWQEMFVSDQPLKVSVNVSPRQISHGNVATDVKKALAVSGLEPEHLTLEITETALMSDPEAAKEVFRELKTLGVRLAVDDFGTGYSSLAYLQDFPFDVLKIDRSFIDGLTKGTQSPAVVRAIIDLGRSLKLQTVAEGIEHDEQLSRFRELECNYGQGYLFARPARGIEIEALFKHRLGVDLAQAKLPIPDVQVTDFA
ncbi:MAG: EAL domain-containing protein [Nitriliruptorales bacterium]|nr:EAL domain-containing protein [Nitriliruptorales bacterium]